MVEGMVGRSGTVAGGGCWETTAPEANKKQREPKKVRDPQWQISSSKAELPKLSQTTLPNGNQVFEYHCLWRTFSFKLLSNGEILELFSIIQTAERESSFCRLPSLPWHCCWLPASPAGARDCAESLERSYRWCFCVKSRLLSWLVARTSVVRGTLPLPVPHLA